MKFVNPSINVPWLGSEIDPTTGEEKSTRNWSRFRFKGEVDRRRLKREVRKAMNTILGRVLDTAELLLVVRTKRIVHDGLNQVDAFADRFGEEAAPVEAERLMPAMFGPGGDGGERAGPRPSDGTGTSSIASELQLDGRKDSELSAPSFIQRLIDDTQIVPAECALPLGDATAASDTPNS